MDSSGREADGASAYFERGEYAPILHLALRLARHFDLPVEAVFSLDAFGQLGAEALATRPAVETDRR